MNLADFQNPIANMPLVQQIRLGQEQAIQQAPFTAARTTDEEVEEQLTTVQESHEGDEGMEVRDDGEQRGFKDRRLPRRRAKEMEEEPPADKKRANDGVHGFHVDVQA